MHNRSLRVIVLRLETEKRIAMSDILLTDKTYKSDDFITHVSNDEPTSGVTLNIEEGVVVVVVVKWNNLTMLIFDNFSWVMATH